MLRLRLLALSLLALATACGGSAAPSSGPAAGGSSSGGGKPGTIAELAMYKGADRLDILTKGAQAEGALTFYSSNSSMEQFSQEFMKKYPFIKVQNYRTQGTDLMNRLRAEFQANKVQADLLETSDVTAAQANQLGWLQELSSPELSAFDDVMVKKGSSGGVMYWGDRQEVYGMGWNTSQIKNEDAPKKLDDLLDPRWKGKMTVVSSTTGVNFIGSLLDTKGMDFVKQLAGQQVRAQNIASVALEGLVVSGEVPLSPTIGLADVKRSQQTKAPVDWYPVEPVVTTIGMSALLTKAPHPNAAILMMDYLHSKEGQEYGLSIGNDTTRKDVSQPGAQRNQDYQKYDPAVKYSPDEYAKNYEAWQKLFEQTFITK
jgi:iron(III) transport system substrate-binding protein